MSQIHDRVIRDNVQKFVDEWFTCKRALSSHGYIKSTMETFHLAKRMLVEDRRSIEDIKSKGDVDYVNLERIMRLQKDDGITYVAMHYPVMSNFKAFYYKKRDEQVHNLIIEHCGDRDGLASIDSMTDALDEIKEYIDPTERIYEQITDELTILEAIQDFMDISDDASYVINKQINSHMNAMKRELERAKKRMVAEDYFKLEEKRVQQLEDLGNRVMTTISLMLNISEN